MNHRCSFSNRNGFNENNQAMITVRNDAHHEFDKFHLLILLLFNTYLLMDLVCR